MIAFHTGVVSFFQCICFKTFSFSLSLLVISSILQLLQSHVTCVVIQKSFDKLKSLFLWYNFFFIVSQPCTSLHTCLTSSISWTPSWTATAAFFPSSCLKSATGTTPPSWTPSGATRRWVQCCRINLQLSFQSYVSFVLLKMWNPLGLIAKCGFHEKKIENSITPSNKLPHLRKLVILLLLPLCSYRFEHFFKSSNRNIWLNY